MNYRYFFLIFLSFFVITGCASKFEKPNPANYGPPPNSYKEKIVQYYEKILKDPGSARYKFGEPRKGYKTEPLFSTLDGDSVTWHGWFVEVQVNAKNSFGGYTGFDKYMVLFEEGKVIDHVKENLNIFHTL